MNVVISETHLETLLQQLGKIVRLQDTKSIASIGEQILSSGMNMIISILIIYAAGIADLGIFSFCFIFATLVGSYYQSLIHKQMMLYGSAVDTAVQNRYFLHALAMNLMFFVLILIGSCLLYWVIPAVSQTGRVFLIATVLFYICLFNLNDLFKHFLYIRNKQVYSLRCTLSSALTTLALTLLTALFMSSEQTVEFVYLSLGIGALVSLLMNTYCSGILKQTSSVSSISFLETTKRFLQQGKFGAVSTSFSWAQGQSLNPIMMLVAGPVIAGYVSFGRLFVMPLNVVNQGLLNSSVPSLRKIYSENGTTDLNSEIYRLLKISYVFSLVYLALLAIMHFTGLLQKFVPDYTNVSRYIVFWAIFLLIAFTRSWMQQYFLVQIRLKLLLAISIITVGLFALGVTGALAILDEYRWILVVMIVSEVISLLLIELAKRKRDVTRQS